MIAELSTQRREDAESFGESSKLTGESPVLPRRLPVQTVERLHRAVGGDALVEEMILRFIANRYGSQSLCHLPPAVAQAALKRPADFIRAAKQFCEPELF